MDKLKLLQIIKEGIEDINKERSLPSKNKWAFYTAIVALIAFGFEIFEASNFNLEHIYLIILPIFFFLQLKNEIYSIFIKNFKGRYLYVDSNIFLRDKKRELYVDLLISSFLYSSIFIVKFEGYNLALMIGLLLPSLVFRILFIIDAFFNIGKDKIRHESKSKWIVMFSSTLLSIVLTYAFYICVKLIWEDLENFSIDSLRLAGIFLLIAILSKEVTKRDYLDYVLKSLTKFKNEINFDVGDINSKYSQIRYLILGLSEPTHIQDLIKRIESKAEKMHSKFAFIKSLLRDFRGTQDEGEKLRIIQKVEKELIEPKKMFNEVKSDTRFLFNKLKVYPNYEVTGLVDGFNPFAEFESNIDEMSEILDEIKQKSF